MSLKLVPIFAICALICSAAAHPAAHLGELRSTSYGGYAVLPIWTEDSGISYLINVTLGSDNQTVPLIFDTGSTETFLNPDCFTLSDENVFKTCMDRPRYNAFTSTSSKFAGGSFSLSYSGGDSLVAGTYVNDAIRIGDATVNARHIGLAATSSNFDAGIFGAGLSAIGDSPSIIEQMVEQGQVSSYVFSVDLGPLNCPEPGTVIFGGIDTKRYRGALTLLEGNGYNTFITAMGLTLPNGTHISYNSSLLNSNNSTKPDTATAGLPVFLDTGSPYNLVPKNLLYAIVESYPDVAVKETGAGRSFEVPYTTNSHTYTYTCTQLTPNLQYTFKKKTIHVPIADTLIRLPNGQCILPFGVPPSTSTAAAAQTARSGHMPYILGNSIMRAAYVVFDLDNNGIWMAARDNCGQDIV
ncbi:acid protease, partial [Plenodomus tracheiphilus IPT5]